MASRIWFSSRLWRSLGNSRVKLTNAKDCANRGLVREGQDPLAVAARQLTRDGVTVASVARTCRDASVCWLTVDASAPDEPGDQVWCTVASGYAGITFLGTRTACEADEF